jgi:hypothetical protein
MFSKSIIQCVFLLYFNLFVVNKFSNPIIQFGTSDSAFYKLILHHTIVLKIILLKAKNPNSIK